MVEFDVVFTGQIANGFLLDEVKVKAAQLFKMDEQRIEALFQSKQVVLKKGVDAVAAEKYKTLLLGMGMLVELRACQSVASISGDVSGAMSVERKEGVQSHLQSDAQDGVKKAQFPDPGFTLAPQPGNLLTPEERSVQQPFVAPPSVNEFTLNEEGENLLKDGEKSKKEQLSIDVSNITLVALEESDEGAIFKE